LRTRTSKSRSAIRRRDAARILYGNTSQPM
jgi:hypothetical protein